MRKFKKFYIEITNVCNLQCDFCPPTRRKPEFMDIERFGKILDQIKDYTNFIYLHVKGEPLLHPELDKFLDLSHEKGFRVNITTNGTMINNVKDKLLMKPALRQVNFSLHSMDGNERFQNNDEYIENIIAFTKEAIDKTELIISLRLWNYNENSTINREINQEINQEINKEINREINQEINQEINREIDQEKRVNNKLLEYIEREFDLGYKIQEKVIPGRGIQIAERIYLNQDHQFKWPDLKEEEDDGIGFCYGLRNQIAILVDGSVVPCCLDGEGVITLGNINLTRFSEIIEVERARNIVDGFSRREALEELCRKCGYRKRFGK
ncbi:MAG TPA: radical SAM/SPASM domain-containing protein [Mobilitalea sp.]|nr:radical SAM/SPASM domain-containing protein [Mobilitalea sp.]